MSCKKIFAAIISLILTILPFAGCASDGTVEEESYSYASSISADDLEVGYDEDNASVIELSDGGISCGEGVSASGGTVTITAGGDYILSGSLSDGTIIVDAAKSEQIRLVLKGVSVSCSTSAPIYIKQADKVFITLEDGTENTLSVTGEYVNEGTDNIDAAIFSKEDLTLNGGGSLEINAQYGHGVVSKDDLIITGGNFTVTASSHAVSGKDCVQIANASLDLTAGKDGVHCENSDDTALGDIYVESGSIKAVCDGDGLDSSAYIQIIGGSFDITSGGGSVNGEEHYDNMFGGFFSSGSTSAQEDATLSAKGIKSQNGTTIADGTFNINSADDCIHSNGSVLVSGGDFTLASGDDGIHADSELVITSGNINITESYEGLEGANVEISGGKITVNSSDDGINAAGGSDEEESARPDNFMSSSNNSITISGGTLYIYADGDGVDSNGALTVSGGETYIAGASSGDNTALDFDGTASVSGGIVIAVGSAGMAQNFSQGTQCAMMVSTSSGQSGEVRLLDSGSNELVSFSPGKSYQSVVISCPEITSSGSYTVVAGEESISVQMNGTIYSDSSGFGGMGGMNGGMNGGGIGGRLF